MNIACVTLRAVAFCLLVLGATRPALAYIDSPHDPAGTRFALADCVVLGKITAVQAEPVIAGKYGGNEKPREFKVATLEISENINGAKDLKKVQVAFLNRDPKVGDEGCFCMVKHVDRDFYVVPGPGPYFLEKDDRTYEKDVALLRRCAKLMEDVDAGLKADDATDRWLTAYLVIYRANYAPVRKPQPGCTFKIEQMEAPQSKLLLGILAEGDWRRTDPETKSSPLLLLKMISYCRGQVGLPPPRDFPRFGWRISGSEEAAARKWVREHAETYRLERLVQVKKGD